MSKLPTPAPLQIKENDWETGNSHRNAMNLPPLPQEDGIPSIPRSAALPNLSTRLSPYSNKGYVGLSENDSRTLEVLNNISITVSSIINQINKLFQRSKDNASFLQELQTVVKRLSDTPFQNVESQKSVQDLHYLLEKQQTSQNHQVSELVKNMNKATSLEIRKELGVCLAHLKKGALDIDQALQSSLQKQSDEVSSFRSTNENLNLLQGTLQGICDNLQQVFPSQEKWNNINASLLERNTELESLTMRSAEYISQLHTITQKLMITDEATDVQRDLISKLHEFMYNQRNEDESYQKQSLLYENWKEVVASHQNDSNLLLKIHTTYEDLEQLVNSFSLLANGDFAHKIEDLKMGHENVSNILKENTQVLLNVQQNIGSFREYPDKNTDFSLRQEELVAKLQALIDRLLFPSDYNREEIQTPRLSTGESLYDILALLHRKLYVEKPKETATENLKSITTDLNNYLETFKDEVSRMSSIYTGSSFSSKTLSLLTATDEHMQKEVDKENNSPELKGLNKNNQELHEHLNSTLTLRNNTLLDNIVSLELKESSLVEKIHKLELSYTQLNMDYDKVRSHYSSKQTAVQELENRSIRLEERLRMLQKWSTNSLAQDNTNAFSEPIPRVVTPPPIDQSSLTNKKKRVPYNTARNSTNLETLDQQRTPNKRFSSFSGSSKVMNRPATASSDKRKPSWSRRFVVALGLGPHSEEKDAQPKNAPTSKKLSSPSTNRSFSSKM